MLKGFWTELEEFAPSHPTLKIESWTAGASNLEVVFEGRYLQGQIESELGRIAGGADAGSFSWKVEAIGGGRWRFSR